jgi:predicted metal-dependent phosphotriesterase family hydrolase
MTIPDLSRSIVSRRECLQMVGSAALGMAVTQLGRSSARDRVETVRGPIDASALGLTLMHEHVLVDFIGADQVSASRYDREEAFRVVRPHLEQARSLGCRTLVECTPAYLGRDPILLQRLSEATGLHILTNTGYYGAVKDKYLPAHAFTESADALARGWIRERAEGIDDTGIKPAFMKISVDAGPLSEVDAKIVRAAAMTHRETGLGIHSHTPDAEAGFAQIALLSREKIPPSAFVWVHAQNVKDPAALVRAAEQGAWIELDGIAPKSVARHVELVELLVSRGHADRVLVSHDAGWYRVGEPGGGAFRPFDTLFSTFLPALRTKGLNDRQIDRLLIDNPRRVLTGAAAG